MSTADTRNVVEHPCASGNAALREKVTAWSATNRACFALVLLALTAPMALGQSHPNQERGFVVEKLYDFGSVDSVSIFNGSAAWSIPLGPSYPGNGGLGYQLRLSGTSTVWDFWSRTYWLPGNPDPVEVTEAEPQRFGNAGFGWRVSLGSLYDPSEPENRTEDEGWFIGRYIYVDEDFGEHTFYETLHYSDSNTAPGESTTDYARDGSFLRLRKLTDFVREVDFPDGRIKRFERATTSSPYQLTQIRDRFGNSIAITYNSPDPLPPGFSSQWKISDGFRDNYVYFKTLLGKQVVGRISVAKSSGGWSNYTLEHTVENIHRSGKHEHLTGTLPPYPPGEFVDVAFLDRVTLPSGATYEMEQYNTDWTVVPDLPGTLARLRLPTRGVIDYSYANRNFPNTGFGYPPGFSLNSSAGVATRKVLKHDGTCPDDPVQGGNCTWAYAYSVQPPNEARVVVTSPLSDDTVHYFAVPPNRIMSSWSGWDYGLPYKPSSADPTGGGRFLSTQVYEGSFTGAGLERSTYVAYEHDQIPPGAGGGAEHPADEWYNTNRRLVSERTVFADDSNSSITTTYSNNDGLSHYRTTTVTGSGFTGSTRTSTTTFNPAHGANPGSGEYRINPATNTVVTTFTMLPTARAWVLGSYDKQTVTEGTSEIAKEVCFERDGSGYASTGFVTRTRAFADASTPSARGGSDVVATFAKNAQGNMTSERYFGGDGAGLGTAAALCDLSISGEADYRIDHTYSNGVRATSQYYDTSANPDVAVPFYSLDQTVHSSGFVTSSRDTAEFQTTYEYDGLGRLERTISDAGPANEDAAERQYDYDEAVGTTLAKVAIKACPPAPASCTTPLQQSEVRFDGHGRVERELRKMADNSDSKRVFVTNAMGYRLKASELQSNGTADNSLSYTQWKGFDPFGRPTTITPPDGTAHNVTVSYTGTRKIARTVKIATNITGTEANATTTETYDLHGSLVKVEEPAGSSDAITTANYGYDAAGRLTSVSHVAGVTQSRSVVYDGRGFLLEEQHPEKVGRVCYLGYDARGHAGRKVDTTSLTCAAAVNTPNGTRDLLYTFDAAERPRLVQEGGTGGHVLKEFYYDTDPIPPVDDLGRSEGKLTHAINHNWVLGTDIEAAQTFGYFGVAGRLSERVTETTGTADHNVFEQGWTYDPLGQVTAISYPVATSGAFYPDPGPQASTVSFTHARGYLTGVSGFATLTYHENGVLAQVVHANGVTDTIGLDPNKMARPASIATSGVDGDNWTSGTYAYDGAGNVKAIGTDKFRYDKVSRLREAKIHAIPGTGGTEYAQTYIFDGFGNLTDVTGYQGIALGTSASTNRLTAQDATFDNAGNLLTWSSGSNTYTWDRLNRMTERTTGGANQRLWKFVYTADDERLWSIDGSAIGEHRIMLRDINGRPLREFAYEPPTASGSLRRPPGLRSPDANGCPASPPNPEPTEDHVFCDGFESGSIITWSPQNYETFKDWIYRGSQLLAAVSYSEGATHFHLDHLGSPRLITAEVPPATALGQHTYLPFGGEIPPTSQDRERMKFTGHERDLSNFSSTADDLDYLHARFSSPITARFLSVDLAAGRPSSPQSWNRYAYVRGNPLKYVDPDGKDVSYATEEDRQFFENAAKRNWKVRRVLRAFAKGSGRDLFVRRRNPGSTPSGIPLRAKTVITVARTPDSEGMRKAYSEAGGGKAGESAANKVSELVSLQSAEIVLGPQARSSDKLHEIGHVDHALRDPAGAEAQMAEAWEAESEAEYENSPAEVTADEFARSAARNDPTESPDQP